jgi:hypothetical protein
LAVVEAWTRCGGSWNAGTSTVMVKPLQFDESMSWIVCHWQFEAMVTHLVAIQQGQGANILHSVPAGVTWGYTETTSWLGLLVTTHSPYPAEHQVATGVCSSCWAVGPLGTSWVASGLHLEGGSVFVCQWCERLRCQTAPTHRWWEVPQ